MFLKSEERPLKQIRTLKAVVRFPEGSFPPPLYIKYMGENRNFYYCK